MSLDYSPQGLLPAYEDDEKARIVCQVVKQLSQSVDPSRLSQSQLQKTAALRYAYISQRPKSLDQIDHMAFLLYAQGGVDVETVKAYYTYLLQPEDAAKWEIKLL